MTPFDARMDVMDFARYIGALVLVLGLVGAAGLAARRFGLGSLVKPVSTRRLAVVEMLSIAPRQRLLIVRRDGVEHLILSGPEGTSVIESGIPAPPMPITAPLMAEAAA
ncbi:MAG: FliO/MopB family protein [Alphaproteobacteria bacterium]|nr:FliO/MopB family protein [Alphaproteobacteria bacterium]